MVCASYIKEDLKFTTKIPINLELGVYVYLLGAYKSNVMIHVGYQNTHKP